MATMKDGNPDKVSDETAIAKENAVSGTGLTERSTDSGFAKEIKNLAMGLILEFPEDAAGPLLLSPDNDFAYDDGVTFRLAGPDDIATICNLRCAQSAEYWELTLTEEEYRLFRAETEAYIRRNLNSRVFFALVERDGEVVSLSGVEVADRMPTIGVRGKAQRYATIVGCYTVPPHRGKGYMRRLLSSLTTMVPLLGIDTVYLESHNSSMQWIAIDAGYEYVSEKYRLDLTREDSRADGLAQPHVPAISAVASPACA